MENTRVSDLTFLKHFSSGNTAMMKQLISVYLQTSADAVTKITAHMNEGNCERIGAVAHQLKPQLSYMGIKAGEPLIVKMEEAAGQQNIELLRSLFAEMKGLVEQSAGELKEELAQLG